MPSHDPERMDALSKAILRLLKRQEETERRLALVEEHLGIEHPEAQPPPPAMPPPAPSPPAEPVRPPVLETRLGLTWVNRVGAITLVLGVGFFFKYAVEKQWLGETVRVLLGVLGGLLALVLAGRIWRSGQRIYAQGIAGAGIAILYVSFYAAYGLYRLLPVQLAFALMALTTAVAAVLALRYDAGAIAALGLLGGYATPIVLRGGADRPWFFFGYILLLDAGALWTARRKNWRVLEALAFSATVFLYLVWFRVPVAPERQFVATFFALAYYALFRFVKLRLVFLTSQVLAAAVLAPIWGPALAPYLLLALLLELAGLAAADRRGRTEAVTATFGAFWLSYAIWYSWAGQSRPWLPVFLFLTTAFLLFFMWMPWRVLGRRARLGSQELVIGALNGAVYFAVCHDLLQPSLYLGLFAVAISALHMLVGRLLWTSEDQRSALLLAGVSWAFLTLAIPIQFSGYRITMIWALEAAALVWISLRTSETRLRYPVVLVFLLVLLRLFAIDLNMYPAPASFPLVVNGRFLTFLLVTLCLWSAADWIRTGRAALVSYVTGHFVLLWILSVETLAWVARTAGSDNLESAQSTAISILLAGYAVVLVGVGVLKRSALNRILGLVLIAMVVLKLYVYDVWLLRLAYRMAAFGGLGALLLLMSYLYSRYRVSIENWRRD